jgi:predicted nucleotidyltransferase
MDKTDVLKIAQNYAGALKDNFDLVKVILFGSYARGNYTDDSDIDIAVVLNDYSNLLDIQLELMRVRRNIDSRIEPHPFRKKDFDMSNPLVNEIVKYGKEIKINAV